MLHHTHHLHIFQYETCLPIIRIDMGIAILLIYSYAYTMSQPILCLNDRDVTERAQGYTLQDASFMRQCDPF